MREVISDRRLTDAEVRVALWWALEHLNRDSETTFVSIEKLAEPLPLGPKTAQRTFENLERYRYIEKAGFYRRARIRRALLDQTHRIDVGLPGPTKADDDTDLGLTTPRAWTPEGDEPGLPSPANQSYEPVEPAGIQWDGSQERGDPLGEEFSDWQLRHMTERWERALLNALRARGSIEPLMQTTDARKLNLAMKLHSGALTIPEACDELERDPRGQYESLD